MSAPNYRSALVNRRKELGLTQSQIAQHIKVSERTVSHWEQGHFLPRLDPFQHADLCELLKWTARELADSFKELHSQNK